MLLVISLAAVAVVCAALGSNQQPYSGPSGGKAYEAWRADLYNCAPLSGTDGATTPDDDAAGVYPCSTRGGQISAIEATDDRMVIVEYSVVTKTVPLIVTVYTVAGIDASTGEVKWTNTASQGDRLKPESVGFSMSSGRVLVMNDGPSTAPSQRPMVILSTRCVARKCVIVRGHASPCVPSCCRGTLRRC